MHAENGTVYAKASNYRSFSAVTSGMTTLKSYLVASGGTPLAPAASSTLVYLSLVATVSFDIQPKYKKYQKDLSNYKLKTLDLDIYLPKHLTHC